ALFRAFRFGGLRGLGLGGLRRFGLGGLRRFGFWSLRRFGARRFGDFRARFPRSLRGSLGGLLRAPGPTSPRGGARADVCHLAPGQLLAVAGAAFVAALGLELEHPQLLAANVPEDLRGDLHPAQAVPIEDGLLGAIENRLQRDARALVVGEALD